MVDEPKEARGGRREARTTQAAQIVDALLEAAAATLSSPSRVALSMRRIARVAGVSIGSVYYYFSNQDELLVQVVDRENGILAARVRAALDRTPASSIADDAHAILAELAAWREEKSWVTKLPVTHLLRSEALTVLLDRAVVTFGGIADEVCRRHHKAPPAREQTAHLVIYLLAVQSLWALEHPAVRDAAASATFVTGFFSQLADAER